MIFRWFLLFFVSWSQTANSQSDSLYFMPPRFGSTDHYLSINPSFRINRPHLFGADLSILTVYSGCMGLTYSGYGIGYMTDPQLRRQRISASVYVGNWIVAFGSQGKLSLNWNKKGSDKSLSIRPEFGITLFIFNLSYGYDVHFFDSKRTFNRHNFTVSTIIPFKYLNSR